MGCGKINLLKKKIKHLIDLERPKPLARYLMKFLPEDKRSHAEVKLDEYAHKLVKDEKRISKQSVIKKIEELSK